MAWVCFRGKGLPMREVSYKTLVAEIWIPSSPPPMRKLFSSSKHITTLLSRPKQYTKVERQFQHFEHRFFNSVLSQALKNMIGTAGMQL